MCSTLLTALQHRLPPINLRENSAGVCCILSPSCSHDFRSVSSQQGGWSPEMGASSGKSISIFANLSNLGSEEWKETPRHLPHSYRRHLSPLLREICVCLESFRPGLKGFCAAQLHWAELPASSCERRGKYLCEGKKPAGMSPRNCDRFSMALCISPAVKSMFCTRKPQPKPLAATNPCG